MPRRGRRKHSASPGAAAEPREIDLHGLTAAEARMRLAAALDALRLSAPGTRVRIVTGLGLRSAGAPVLHGLVRQLLETGSLAAVASWWEGSDGGSYLVRLCGAGAGADGGPGPGRAGGSTRAGAPTRLDDRAWHNARQLEKARRQAERDAESEADEERERRRLEAERAACGGRELPAWLCEPPPDLVAARQRRAAEAAADAAEYRLTRAEIEARRSR